jgi:hypothetical protein
MLWRQCHGQPRNRESAAALGGVDRWLPSSTSIRSERMADLNDLEIGHTRSRVVHAHRGVLHANSGALSCKNLEVARSVAYASLSHLPRTRRRSDRLTGSTRTMSESPAALRVVIASDNFLTREGLGPTEISRMTGTSSDARSSRDSRESSSLRSCPRRVVPRGSASDNRRGKWAPHVST